MNRTRSSETTRNAWLRRSLLGAGMGAIAFALTPAAAQFRVEISGVGGTTGEAIVEVYEVP